MDTKTWLIKLDKRNISIRLKSFVKAVGSILLYIITGIGFDLLNNDLYNYGYFIIVVLLILNTTITISKQLRIIFLELENLVYKNCDCISYLKVTKECLDDCDECIKHYKKLIRFFLEEQYVKALMVNECYDDARMFLQREWSGKKNVTYRQLTINLEYNVAFKNKDQVACRSAYKKFNSIYKRQKFFQIENMIMEAEYNLALEKLQKLNCKTTYEKCVCWSLQSYCYKKMGDMENAKQLSIYLWEHGGQLPACRREEKFLCEQGMNMTQLKKKQYNSNTIHVICDQVYEHKRYKEKHIALGLIGIFGYIDFILSWNATTSMYSFDFIAASKYIQMIQYSPFIMALILFVYMIYIISSKKTFKDTFFEVLFHTDGFDIVDEQGQLYHGKRIIEKIYGYQLLVSNGISHSIYHGTYTIQEKQKIEQFVKEEKINKIFSTIYKALMIIGVFLLIGFTISAYELH